MTQYSGNNKLMVAYGLTQALENLSPIPIVAKRAPGVNDMAQLGTLWIYPAVNGAWILTSIVNNSATWSDTSGGAGIFTSLTVNPGPTSLSTVGVGAVSIGNSANTSAITLTSGAGGIALVGGGNTIAIGNDAAANTVNIGSTTGAASLALESGTGGTTLTTGVTGTISLGTAAMTGTITLGQSTAGQTVNISNAAGANTVNIATGAAAQSVTVGSTNTSSFLKLQAGSGGLSLLGGQILNSKVTSGTAGTYVLLATDQFVGTDTTAGVLSITLPSAPVTGRFITIYDATGQAAANNVTINGNGKNISAGGTSAGTKALTTAYQSMNLWYNGTIWNGQIIT